MNICNTFFTKINELKLLIIDEHIRVRKNVLLKQNKLILQTIFKKI